MQIPVVLDRADTLSLEEQLVRQLRDAIRCGRIKSGMRLPSTRLFADQVGVSRNTAVRAYDVLCADGYAESRPAAGTYVAQRLPDAPLPAEPRPEPPPAPVVMPEPLVDAAAPDPVARNRHRVSIDFFPGRPCPALFPLKLWRRLLMRGLSQGGAAGLTNDMDPAGLLALRQAIADLIGPSRAVIADPDRIIIVAGVQEGITIAARLFLTQGTPVVTETPCALGAALAFESFGARVIPVPVDGGGLMLGALPEQKVALAYLTPSHQFPTGATLELERRRGLIAWARRNRCYILEDDSDSEFRYEGAPLPAVAALAPDCTIYLGGFAKSLGPGLRLGYMVVPAPLAAAARRIKALLNNGNPWLEQMALAEMIRTGSFSAHLLRIRGRYRESRDALLAALRQHFGERGIGPAAGGLHLFWRPDDSLPDAARLETMARRVRVGLYGLVNGGAYEPAESPLGRRGVILGYAALRPEEIASGIGRLAREVAEAKRADVAVSRQSRIRGLNLDRTVSRQPALPMRHDGQPDLATGGRAEEKGGMIVVSGLYRYPIKGLSAQPVRRERLEPGRPFPMDRVFALARPDSPIDKERPRWAKKGQFVMLMLDEGLAEVTTELDIETLELTITRDGFELLRANLGDRARHADVEAFFRRLVPRLHGTPRLVAAGDGHFMDKPDNVVSLINLATVRSLERMWGYAIDPMRFRANIYIDGAEPWEEFGWIGAELSIGGARLAVDRRNGRCAATNVNPVTGQRDLDLPGALRAEFGHKDLGVYLVARGGGDVAVGDEVSIVGASGTPAAPASPGAPVPGRRKYICGGCYYVYDPSVGAPAQGVAASTAFAAIPDDWPCPDCGGRKDKFGPFRAR